jgi:23S rRNA (uracil1939-C5)-methyltransferase
VIENGVDAGELAGLIELVPALSAVWSLGRKGQVLGFAGAEALSERWGEAELPLSGTAFLQVNRETAMHLDDHARKQCDGGEGTRIVDAYCGYGLRALELARAGNDVVAIDLDRGAVRAARRLARKAGASVEFKAERVESALRRALPADVVVLNPPRRGVDRPVVATLLENPPERIVYVSCDPATLSRDIRGLSPAYDLAAVRAFDLFPQTAHVETVATLTRRSM